MNTMMNRVSACQCLAWPQMHPAPSARSAPSAPSDPFVGALAQQWMDSLKEKEDMVGGVNKARHVIEMLAESDKAKTKTIEALSDEILRLGGTVPEIAKQGVEWSAEAFEQMGM